MRLELGTKKESKKKIFSFSLKELNHLAEHNSFSLDDIEFQNSPSKKILWMPDNMLPLSYLPGFCNLSEPLQKKINQSYAQAICEQFIWFEQILLCRILKKIMLKEKLPSDLKICLQHFYDEEEKHSELFWRVLEYSDPSLYFDRTFAYYHTTFLQEKFIDLIANHPDRFLVWIWLAIFFEERTVEFSRKYKTTKEPLEPVFARAHYLHLLDESRHIQIDQYLLKNFYEPSSTRRKKVAAWMLHIVLDAYVSPRRVARNIIKQTLKEFPEEHQNLQKLQKQLPDLRTHKTFQGSTFGPKALPRTHALLSNYEEMSRVQNLLSIT